MDGWRRPRSCHHHRKSPPAGAQRTHVMAPMDAAACRRTNTCS